MTLKWLVASVLGSACFLLSMKEDDRTVQRLLCIEGALWFILGEVAR